MDLQDEFSKLIEHSGCQFSLSVDGVPTLLRVEDITRADGLLPAFYWAMEKRGFRTGAAIHASEDGLTGFVVDTRATELPACIQLPVFLDVLVENVIRAHEITHAPEGLCVVSLDGLVGQFIAAVRRQVVTRTLTPAGEEGDE